MNKRKLFWGEGVYIVRVCAVSVDVDLCTEFSICSYLVSRVGQGIASSDAIASYRIRDRAILPYFTLFAVRARIL